VTLNIKVVPDEKIKKFLMEKYQIPDYQADVCVAFAQGNVGKAIQLASSDDFNEMKASALQLIKRLDDIDLYEMTAAVKQIADYKLEINDYFDLMMIWYRDVLYFKATGDVNGLIFKDEVYDIKRQAEKSSYNGINSILEALRKAQIRLDANVNFDLVIAGSGFEEFSSDVNIMYLSDLCGNQAAEEAMWEKDTIPQKKIVTKYQPMEQLLHEIYVQAGMTKREPVGVQVATHGKVIGVVSPECHEMQELFSVMHAVNLGREQKVLYFNFLEFSGFRELFGQTGNFDFTDVVLKLRSGELTTEYFWNCVYEMSGISVILPFENPENIRQIGRQEWEQFIDFMEQNTDFELLVVDFGVSMPELADCMSRCDELLLIGREGYFYECRDKHFYEWLEKTGHQAVAEKIRKVNVPYTAKNIHGGGNVIEQLQWSEFGDFVRRWKEIMDE